jgi:hypothetical protein
LQRTCKKILDERQSLLKSILGDAIEFDVYGNFTPPDEKDRDLWAWTGMETKIDKVGSCYAGYFWDGRSGRNEVQAFASLAFNKKSEHRRAKMLLQAEIERGDLVSDDKWWEIYHFISLSPSDYDNYSKPLEAAIDRWIAILAQARFLERFLAQ